MITPVRPRPSPRRWGTSAGWVAYLGEAQLPAGRRDDAVAVAQRALDLAHLQKERGNEAWILSLLGDIAAHADGST